MRLLVLLDEVVDESFLKEDDIILCNTGDIERKYCTHIVIRIDKNVGSESVSLFESAKKVFGDSKESVQSLKNPLYARILKPLANTVLTIDELIYERSIKEIVLVGGSNFAFLTMRHGDGEGNKKMYKTSWFITPLLYQKYKNNHDVIVSWVKRKPAIFLKFFHIVRESLFIIKSLVDEVKYKGDRFSSVERKPSNEPVIVAYTQKPLQRRHISGLFSSITNNFTIYHIVGLGDENANEDIQLTKLSLKQVFIIFKQCRKDLLNAEFDFKWNGINVFIDSWTLFMVGCAELFHVCAEINKIDLTLNRQRICADYLVTNMTFGADLFSINRYCRKNSIKHYNFQYVSMAKLLFPDIDLADKYYILSPKVYKLYSQYSDKYCLYFPFSDRDKNIIKEEMVITIFLQPDWYAERYKTFVDEFCRYLVRFPAKIRLNIKPHYRQNMEEAFKNICQNYDFCRYVDKETSVNDLLRKSNFAMSMTSSVLLEAVCVGTPAFIIDIDGKDTEAISNNDSTVEEVNFRCRSYNEIISYLNTPQDSIQKYEQRRQDFISKTQAITTIIDAFE